MAQHQLSATKVRSAIPGEYSDGSGLLLIVDKTGSKRWKQRYTFGGKRVKIGLGSVAQGVTLAMARERSSEVREQVAQGIDPQMAKRLSVAATSPDIRTFDDVVREYIETNEPTWSNSKHIAQWRMTMLGPTKWIEGKSVDYCKRIHSKPIADVDTDDILAILKPVWLEVPDTATKVRGRIESVIAYAEARGWFTGKNPAQLRNHLDKLLPSQAGLPRGHFKRVPVAEMPEAYAKIRRYNGFGSIALQFAILTATRENPVIKAEWPQIDFDTKIWNIPAETMKGSKGRKREHRVPLSEAALDILKTIQTESPPTRYIFLGRFGGAMSDATMDQVFKRLGIDATPHGTARSTFMDWAIDVGEFDESLADKALAHTEQSKVKRAYRRDDALERRRPMMQAWADYCLSASGDDNGEA